MKPLIKTRQITCILLLALSLLFLSNCSSIIGSGVIRESISNFDQSKSISMSPAGMKVLKGSALGIYPDLGAVWNSKNPKYIGLVIEQKSSTGITGVNSPLYVNIKGLDVNIDGKKYQFETSGVTDFNSDRYNSVSGINTSSSNMVIVPLALVKQMLSAQSCVIRVRTNKGNSEHDFTQESAGGFKLAKYHLRNFLIRIAQNS